jgi:NADPH-dependent 2,4-dienoyl-CoA reductase/sulfur reductase-like enzyme
MLGASIGTLGSKSLYARSKPRVVVIGGGPGGTTAARYLALGAQGALDITLIEPQRRFTTCFFSNHYLAGLRRIGSITHGYEGVRRSGVRVVHERALAIIPERRFVLLPNRDRLPYDRLIVAPGIDLKYESISGYSPAAAETMPHAWQAGDQTRLLSRRLNALQDGAVIVMITPPNPYRCPPGPYERASLFAHVLKRKGHKRSRIVILDTKASFSKQSLFAEGWARHYPGMIEWLDPKAHGGSLEVLRASGEVRTANAKYRADLVNVIPAQRAGVIAKQTGLTDDTEFCPIMPESMRSRRDDNIYILGDACNAGDMPKSAFAANSQAKVAAMTILADLLSQPLLPAQYTNTCWSLIAEQDCVKVGGIYAPGDGKITALSTFVSQSNEDHARRSGNVQEARNWYESIVTDVFG